MSTAQSSRSKKTPPASSADQTTTRSDSDDLYRAPTADKDDYLIQEEPSIKTPEERTSTRRPRELRRLSTDTKVMYIVAKETVVEKTTSKIGAIQAKWLGGVK